MGSFLGEGEGGTKITSFVTPPIPPKGSLEEDGLSNAMRFWGPTGEGVGDIIIAALEATKSFRIFSPSSGWARCANSSFT